MPAATVLIVEDDLDLQDFLRDVLGDQGYSVTMAANGLEALAALSRGPRPNVILLDLMMPLMDGWQFLAEVRAHGPYPDVPVVVETASKEPVVGGQRGGEKAV
jgi:CheY-like chemotaxis protein